MNATYGTSPVVNGHYLASDGRWYPVPYVAPSGASYVQPRTVYTKARFPHGKHLVLDLVTFGLWIPVHFVLWVVHS